MQLEDRTDQAPSAEYTRVTTVELDHPCSTREHNDPCEFGEATERRLPPEVAQLALRTDICLCYRCSLAFTLIECRRDHG